MSEEKKKKHPPAAIEPEIPDDVVEGVYANAAHVIFSAAEFLLDFGRIVPGRQGVRVHTRIILTPLHAKHLAAAISENVRRFEEQFGEIKIPKGPPDLGPVGFKQ